VVISYWGATLIHTRRFILRALEGNAESAVSLLWCQSAINPLRLLFGAGSPAELSFPWGEVAKIPLEVLLLWEVIVDDLFFGTVFWVAIVFLVVVHTSRRVGDA
jgi:hypothetical protein